VAARGRNLEPSNFCAISRGYQARIVGGLATHDLGQILPAEALVDFDKRSASLIGQTEPNGKLRA
jgi:hypothetical protein